MLALAATAEASMGGFSVSPVFPDNQVPATAGFFDLNVTAGEQQELIITVTNTRDTDLMVEIDLTPAMTNMNGIIVYPPLSDLEGEIYSPFLNITTIAGNLNEVLIPAGETIEIPFTVNIPAQGFDGIILGGIRVLQGLTEEDMEGAGAIVNRFAHVIPVRLRENDNPIEVMLTFGEVNAELFDRRAQIVAEVHNPQPRLVMGAIAEARIYPLGMDEPIFASSNVSVDFAPNSTFPITFVDRGGFGVVAGDYLAIVSVEHDGQIWNFEQEFTIDPVVAEEINTGAINVQQAPPQQLGGLGAGGGTDGDFPVLLVAIISAAVVIIILIVVIAILIMKNNKAKLLEQEAKHKRDMARKLKLLEAEANAGVEK